MVLGAGGGGGGNGGCDYHVSRQVGWGWSEMLTFPTNRWFMTGWVGGGGHDYHVSRQGGGWGGSEMLTFPTNRWFMARGDSILGTSTGA